MIIAIANQKGGQGKTTTAQAIANGAAYKGHRSLAIDFDPQCNLTFSFGGNSAGRGAYDLLTGTPAAEVIQRTQQGDIITASTSLALADTQLTGKQRATALRDGLKPIKAKYDVITIDCPPTLNVLLVNALNAADVVIIPMTADAYSLQGLYSLRESISAAQKTNKALTVGGVLFTMRGRRTIQDNDLTELITETCSKLEIPVFNTIIRNGVRIREAQTLRQSIFDYAPKTNVARDYLAFLDELGI